MRYVLAGSKIKWEKLVSDYKQVCWAAAVGRVEMRSVWNRVARKSRENMQ
jgi:hypothetical protein